MNLTRFEDLGVWQLSSAFSAEIASLVRTFPKQERFELADDLLRSARSIPSNIAEGFGRFHFAEKIQFYNIAKGSVLEVQNHLAEAMNNKYNIDGSKYDYFVKKYHVDEVKLNKLIAATNRAKKKYAKKVQR